MLEQNVNAEPFYYGHSVFFLNRSEPILPESQNHKSQLDIPVISVGYVKRASTGKILPP
jgi:hypothetical protein